MSEKMTTEECKNRLFNLYKNEYELLSEYININTKVKIRHNVCNKIYEVTPNGILNKKTKCPYCNKGIRYNLDIFKNNVYKLTKDEYTVLGEYINCHTKILMKHNICGNEYKVTPNHFIQGTRCPYCDKTKKLTIESFKQKVKDITNDEYTVLSDNYINNETKIKIRHNVCKNEYLVAPKNFLRTNGNRCPYCNRINKESKAIKLIKNYLKTNNIKFIEEKRFKTCKDINTLPFDFYLPDYDLLIEYDGKQHYVIDNNSFFNEDYYNICHKHDEIKNNWCKDNNKDLLRIKYTQDPIKTLDNYLNDNYEIIEE